jgi:integrase
MASIQKTAKGYRIQYFNRGSRQSATFPTQRECKEWLKEREAENAIEPAKRITLGELLTEYEKKVTVNKKSAENESKRINVLKNRYPELMGKLIGDVNKNDISAWRDDMYERPNGRGGLVKQSSVARYWTTMNNAFAVAITDWGWLKVNPMTGVTRPKESRHRERIITSEEREKLLFVTSYSEEGEIDTIAKLVIATFLFAWETGMRAGEMRSLRWSDIDGRIARLEDAKTEAGIRKVPLSKEAIRIIEQVRKSNLDEERIFPMTAKQLDSNFRKYRKKAGLSGFTFHDSRATAITHLSKKIDILALAKAIGHKNLDMLLVYYREPVEAIAARLD